MYILYTYKIAYIKNLEKTDINRIYFYTFARFLKQRAFFLIIKEIENENQ